MARGEVSQPPRRVRGKDAAEPPAIAAARAGDGEALRTLPTVDVLVAKDRNGCGCLHWAAGNGDLDACDFLVHSVGIGVDDLTWNSRTPLHYAARNGRLHVCRWLVEEAGAKADALARDDVTPFQMAVWQNRAEVCRWFVNGAGVDPRQVNRYACTAGHWVALAPRERAGASGSELIPLAGWLLERGVSFATRQSMGHTAMHKAAWSGHQELCAWMRDECEMWDDVADSSGNYAADLAEMGSHDDLAGWLRLHCSASRAESFAVLGVPFGTDMAAVRAAYLQRVRECHPDRGHGQANGDVGAFVGVAEAYRHLTWESGAGAQRNLKHSQLLMLKAPGAVEDDAVEVETTSASGGVLQSSDVGMFKARLLAVVAEYGEKGLPASLLQRKYGQVWGEGSFPEPADFGIVRKKVGLLGMLQLVAGDAVRIERFGDGRQSLLHPAVPSARAAPSAMAEE